MKIWSMEKCRAWKRSSKFSNDYASRMNYIYSNMVLLHPLSFKGLTLGLSSLAWDADAFIIIGMCPTWIALVFTLITTS
jgi:hypothetical protein